MRDTYISKEIINAALEKISDTTLTNFKFDKWNSEYEGFSFKFNKLNFKSRLAKKTPNKKGYFVAFWRKDEINKNTPFDYDSLGDKLIINVQDNNNIGQFIFPSDVLVEQGIIKSDRYKGKMAMRVYPSWVSNLNATAKKTQRWQTKYFIDLSNTIDIKLLSQLYL